MTKKQLNDLPCGTIIQCGDDAEERYKIGLNDNGTKVCFSLKYDLEHYWIQFEANCENIKCV